MNPLLNRGGLGELKEYLACSGLRQGSPDQSRMILKNQADSPSMHDDKLSINPDFA